MNVNQPGPSAPIPRQTAGDALSDRSPTHSDTDELSQLAAEIEGLVELDPADAADAASRIADQLGRHLEEDDR